MAISAPASRRLRSTGRRSAATTGATRLPAPPPSAANPEGNNASPQRDPRRETPRKLRPRKLFCLKMHHGSPLCFGLVKDCAVWSLVGESHASVCVRVLTPPFTV